MTSHQTNTGYEPNVSANANVSINTTNREMDTSGATFVPEVDLTHDDDDTNSHRSDIPLQLPARANSPSNHSALLTFSRASKCACSSWTSRSCFLVTQKTGEALYDQRETARRASLHLKGESLAATHQFEAAARQNLVNTLARNDEEHNYNVQMHVRQRERKADSRFSQRQRELLSRFSQKANHALANQREILVTEVTAEVWRRDKKVHDLRKELSLHALHSEDIAQQQSRTRWTASALDRLGSGNTAISRDAWRVWSCSISRGTGNWSTSTKRGRISTRSMRLVHTQLSLQFVDLDTTSTRSGDRSFQWTSQKKVTGRRLGHNYLKAPWPFVALEMANHGHAKVWRVCEELWRRFHGVFEGGFKGVSEAGSEAGRGCFRCGVAQGFWTGFWTEEGSMVWKMFFERFFLKGHWRVFWDFVWKEFWNGEDE